MSELEESYDRPPLICPTCASHQVHDPIDVDKVSFYCPHRQAWVRWDEEAKRWECSHGVTPEMHHRTLRALKAIAISTVLEQIDRIRGL